MDRAQLESSLELKLYEFCKDEGIICVKLNIHGRRGWPDRELLYKKHVLFIELKRAGETTEPLQDYVHRLIRDQGFTVMVFDDLTEAKLYIKGWKYAADSKHLAGPG